MGEELAAKIYWDRETGYVCLITEPGIEGLDKFNFMIDLGPELNKWRAYTNNEQRLIDLYPVLRDDATEAKLIGKFLSGITTTTASEVFEVEGEEEEA